MSHYRTIQALGTPVVLYSQLTKFLGSLTASAFLSHIMYWSDKTDNPLGVYKSCEQITDEIGLSKKEQMTARKILTSLGLITETHKRLEHRMYYRFESDVFDAWFDEHLAKLPNGTPPIAKSERPEVPKGNFGENQNGTSLFTKITTKNTTKITAENIHEHTRENSQNSQTTNTSDDQKTLNVSFDDFWDMYDKKQDKPKCQRLWLKLTDQERLDIMDYLPKYKQSQPNKQYRKNPHTFLNNRSWENEIIDSTGHRHATHQPNYNTPNAIQPASDAEQFHARNMAEFNAFYGFPSQPTAGAEHFGHVYDMENQFSRQDESRGLGFDHSSNLGSGFE